jgi:hypothetical protein
MAGSSRLVFAIPSDWAGTDFTLQAILQECMRLPLRVAPSALPPPRLVVPIRPSVRRLLMELGNEKIRKMAGVIIAAHEEPSPDKVQKALRAAAARLHAEEKKTFDKIAEMPLKFLIALREPKDNETALEIPYRLILSPNKYAAWIHAVEPAERNGNTELWHTRLAVRPSPNSGELGLEHLYQRLKTLRAIWAEGFSPAVDDIPLKNNIPFRMSLNSYDRANFVHLSSNYTGLVRDEQRYVPLPIEARRLMLSSYGAWLTSRGAWEPPDNLSVEEWCHRATMGRDHYVRVVYKGYLFPFGHRASLIKITERKFCRAPSGGKTAYLFQRMYIVVREPEKSFGTSNLRNPDSGASYDLQMPWKRVRITTLVTPDLKDPEKCLIVNPADDGSGVINTFAFWPKVGNSYFQFHVVCEDGDGREIEAAVPLVFIENNLAHACDKNKEDPLEIIRDAYLANHDDQRKIDLQGQLMAFADSVAPGDTSLETQSVTMSAEIPRHDPAGDQPRFFPVVEQAGIKLAAARYFAGDNNECKIHFDPDYLINGLDAHAGVFARIGEAGSDGSFLLDLQRNGDKTGALLNPSMRVTGLSRVMGPVAGDPSKLAAGNFQPADFFGGAGATLLGSIELADIIRLPGVPGLDLDKIPRFITEQTGNTALEPPRPMKIAFTWKPDLKSTDPPIFQVGGNAEMIVDVLMEVPIDGGLPTIRSKATLSDFKLQLIAPNPFFIIDFNSIEFLAETGKSMDVSADIRDIVFAGPLSFIETLKDFIPLDGFVDPPAIDVSADGIRASYSLPIPSIAVGMFSLQNISLGAGFSIPFVNEPLSVSFNFCTRENPFILTVMCFGGSGFFSIVVNPDGVHTLEAGFEFGASLALSFGVASGEVHIMAGIYFKLQGDESKVEGYLRMGGSLDVMGIISVSVELCMILEYDSNTKKVWGRATLTIEVEILFITIPVEVTLERRFAGSAGDPSFEEYMLPYEGPDIYSPSEIIIIDPWKEYCEAFA